MLHPLVSGKGAAMTDESQVAITEMLQRAGRGKRFVASELAPLLYDRMRGSGGQASGARVAGTHAAAHRSGA